MPKKGKGSKAAAAEAVMDPATRRGIISIGVLALDLIVFFSLFGWAGTIGTYLDTALTAVVGLGRYAIPIFLLIIVYNLLYPREEESELSPLFGLGIAAMSIGVFGLIDVSQPQAGGYVGVALTYIFRQFSSVGVAVVVFVALLLISVLIVFNTSLQHLIQHIPARSFSGKTLRFIVALFASARQRIAIAKEQALASVEEAEPAEVEDEDELMDEDEDEPEEDVDDAEDADEDTGASAFTERSLETLVAGGMDMGKPTKQMKLNVTKHHRKLIYHLNCYRAIKVNQPVGILNTTKISL